MSFLMVEIIVILQVYYSNIHLLYMSMHLQFLLILLLFCFILSSDSTFCDVTNNKLSKMLEC